MAELHLEDRPESGLLTAAGEVVAEAGPNTKAVLSAMNRGLERRLQMGTWDAVVAGLVAVGVVAPASGSLRPRHEVIASVTDDDERTCWSSLRLSGQGPRSWG